MLRFRVLISSLVLILASLASGAEPAPVWYVVTQGTLAGSQVAALPDGSAQLPELSGGLTGVVRSTDGGVTWYYLAADGTHNPLRPVDRAPVYARAVSDVVTELAALERGRSSRPLAESVSRAGRVLTRAAEDWNNSSADPVTAAGAAALAELASGLAQSVGTRGEAELAMVVRAALPRLRALATTALLQPRDNAITIGPSPLDFGSVPVGSTVSSTVSIINNTNTDQKVDVNDSGLSAPFSGGGNFSVTVGAHHNTFATVRFAPTAQGPFTSTFVINNALLPGGSVTVTVKGTGVAPVIQATPRPVDFGKVAVGNFKTLEFTVQNLSAAQAEVSTVLELKTPFSFGAVGDLNGTFPANGKGAVNISFSPKKAGTFTGAITIRTSASTGAVVVPVVGVATSLFTADVETLDFGDVKVGTAAVKQVVITNNSDGEQPLAIKAPGAPFTIGTVPATVPAHGSVTIPVTFTPAKTGAASSSFEVSTGKKKTALTIHAKGNGIENTSIHFSTTSVAFGMVPHGTGKTQGFTISNSSKAPFNVTLDRSNLPTTFFTMQSPLTFTVLAGGSSDVMIFFEANAKCTHKGKLNVSIGGETFVIDVTATAD